MYKPILALLLAGCSDYGANCPGFEEIEVTDPDDLAPPETVARIRAAIDDFALWSGRDGVCVGEARVEELDSERRDYSGRYVGRTIRIDPEISEVEETVRHELCHALDDHERLAWDHRELFPGDVPRIGARNDPGEIFARSCEPHPGELAVEALFPQCATLTPQDAFLADRVWMGGDLGFSTAVIGAERRDLTGMPLDGYAPGAGLVTSADAAYLALVDDSGADDVVSVIRIDPATAAVSTTIAGPTVSSEATWALVGGDDDPLLVVFDGAASAWRIRGDALVPTAFPQEITGFHYGVIADGAAWVDATIDDETSLRRVDLETLAVVDVATPPASSDTYVDVRFLRAGVADITSSYTGHDGESGIGRLSTTDLSWSFAEIPTSLFTWTSMALEDDRVLARWFTEIDGDLVSGFGVFDPASGAWTIDANACGANATNFGGGFALLGGRPYWFEWADEDGVHPTFGLVEITLPPR